MSIALRDARVVFGDLRTWASTEAYPLWREQGVDRGNGGFHESIAQDGQPVLSPRRARVQPRQIYAFSVAPRLGWDGDAASVVDRGLGFFIGNYTRPDGFFRTLVAHDGKPLDETVVVYDQAFALFGLSYAFAALNRPTELREMAETLRDNLTTNLSHPLGGLEEWPHTKGQPRVLPLISNPHMHLLEACLAWQAAGADKDWRVLADQVVKLALSKFIDADIGGLREFFDGDWNPAPGVPGRIMEPGHQFEWAWLLLRWGKQNSRQDAIDAAMKMIEIGEGPGLDATRGVSVQQLLDDMSVHDPVARLWPQTERIKAAAMAARITGDDRYWTMAAEAGRGLMKYFQTPVRGLWWDKMKPDGSFVDEPAPASSFYHIVCAILELEDALRDAI